jgi:hypothetical protein
MHLFHENHFDCAKLGELAVTVSLKGAEGFLPKTVLGVEPAWPLF